MKTLFYTLLALCGTGFSLVIVTALGHDMGLIARFWYNFFSLVTIGIGLMGLIVGNILVYSKGE